jgi:putative transposase
MRGPKPEMISLSEVERKELERFVHRHSTPQQQALRARIILGAASGKQNSQLARELEGSAETVRLWRRRWVNWQGVWLQDLPIKQRFQDVPRAGRPSQITAEQSSQMMALACEQPKERPISHWTGREMADELVARGIIKQLSPRHAARLLKKGASSRT